jgi:glutamyl-tRNA reductase
LDRLFSAAFKAAKMVRTETELGKKAVSMASLVSIRLDEIIADTQDANIAIIGSGSMTPKMAEILRKKHKNQIYFVNRTVSKVEPYAEKYNGKALSLDDFLSGDYKVTVVISSTSSTEPIFTPHNIAAFTNGGDKFFAFDLAIPRDFASSLDNSESLEIWNLEKLNQLAQINRRERFRTVDQANRIIDEQLRIYLRKEITQMISPLFDSALDESMTLAEEGLVNLFNSKLAHLSPDDQATLLHWSKKVLSRACYLPARQLAEQIANDDIEQDRNLSLFVKMAR